MTAEIGVAVSGTSVHTEEKLNFTRQMDDGEKERWHVVLVEGGHYLCRQKLAERARVPSNLIFSAAEDDEIGKLFLTELSKK